MATLRLRASRHRPVTLKCGVGRLVDWLTNGGRCARGAVSSNGEPSPKRSGMRSDLSDESLSCPLEGCKLVVVQRRGLAHLTRNGRGVLAGRLGMSE